ncbi:MAG: DUF3618 domain-containing protein [Mycobacterium sp.]
MADADRLPPEPGPDAGIDDLKSDIEATRVQLSETVGALSDKLDVKGRAQEKAGETRDALAQRAQEASATVRSNPAVPAGIVVAALAVIGLLWWRRRR